MNQADIESFHFHLDKFLDSPNMDSLTKLAKAMQLARGSAGDYPWWRSKHTAPYCLRDRIGDAVCFICPLHHFEFGGIRRLWLCTSLEDDRQFRDVNIHDQLKHSITDITVAFMILRELLKGDMTNE